jgi:hypothetical protein
MASVPENKIMTEPASTPVNSSFQAGVIDEGISSLKFKVWFSNPTREKVNLQIESEMGILFSRQYTEAWYGQIYDLSQLEDGVYYFVFEKGREQIKRRVVIRTNVETTRTKVVE